MLRAGIRCTRLHAHWRVRAAKPSVRCMAAATERLVKVSHVLVKADQGPLLDEAESLLKGGASFEEVAKSTSMCSSKTQGGGLGWLRRGTFFPDVERVAFSLAVGDVGRATSPRGIHLLKVTEEKFQAPVQQMTVQELYEVVHNPALAEDCQFVDVREEWEYNTARLPGFTLLPLSRFEEWAGSVSEQLDPQKETIVLCHHGVRSMQMAQYLVQQGFADVKNVTGGIDAYSQGADSSVPMY